MSHSNEHENLSALMDGELTHEQVRFMLRRADAHDGLCMTWERYHLIGSAVRGELTSVAGEGFAVGVMERIKRESDAAATRPRHPAQRWLRWSGGGVIAAGVAVVALVLVQPQMQRAPLATQTAQSAAVPAPTIASVQATQDAAGGEAEPVAAIPAAPHWLQALPSAGQYAIPAAAHFTSLDQWMHMNDQPGYYQRQLAPYVQPTDSQPFDSVAFHGPYLPQVAPQPAYPPYPGSQPE